MPDPRDVPKTIIFVQTKNVACKIFAVLKAACIRFPDRVGMYHASNSENTKRQIRRDFMGQTDLKCLVSLWNGENIIALGCEQ